MEEVDGVAGVPLAVAVVEVELHEVAGDGGDEHVAGLRADGVVELEDAVVPGPARARLHPAARQDLRHGLGHRRLLRDVEHADRAAAGRHREGGGGGRRREAGGTAGRRGKGREVSAYWGWFSKF